jgi:hypothetical protein
MRIIDLSATIATSRPDALPFERVEITYLSHAEGASQIETMLKVPPDLLRNAEGWAVEEFTGRKWCQSLMPLMRHPV